MLCSVSLLFLAAVFDLRLACTPSRFLLGFFVVPYFVISFVPLGQLVLLGPFVLHQRVSRGRLIGTVSRQRGLGENK